MTSGLVEDAPRAGAIAEIWFLESDLRKWFGFSVTQFLCFTVSRERRGRGGCFFCDFIAPGVKSQGLGTRDKGIGAGREMGLCE